MITFNIEQHDGHFDLVLTDPAKPLLRVTIASASTMAGIPQTPETVTTYVDKRQPRKMVDDTSYRHLYKQTVNHTYAGGVGSRDCTTATDVPARRDFPAKFTNLDKLAAIAFHLETAHRLANELRNGAPAANNNRLYVAQNCCKDAWKLISAIRETGL